jgi:hypothetical protein
MPDMEAGNYHRYALVLQTCEGGRRDWRFLGARLFIFSVFLLLHPGVQGSETLFRDDFIHSTLDRTLWGIADWKLGRTQLGLEPELREGIARLSFQTMQFAGTEIYTQRFFSRETGIEIKVRARLGKNPPGLVSGVFTYTTGTDGASDEIDIEFLSKSTSGAKNQLPVLLSTWRQWDEASADLDDVAHHWSTRISLVGRDPLAWHEYAIRWLPDRTEWFIDQKLVASSFQAQPDQPTRIHFNLWAPSASWALAYSPFLLPSPDPRINHKYSFDLDWVEINRL